MAGERKKGELTQMGVASLVNGIVGFFFFGIILEPLAIILGAVAWRRDRDMLGLAGMSLGIIGIIFVVLAVGVYYSTR